MRTIAFIDASNLFYGGEKSLGWKIDYQKLLLYLQKRYGVETTYYFGGVEIHHFPFDPIHNFSVPVVQLMQYYNKSISETVNTHQITLLQNSLKRAKFYAKLEAFGYVLCLKPVKIYQQPDGTIKKKANCDVDMTFYLMKEKEYFDRAIVLSGDGDFLPVLLHLKGIGKEVLILSRGKRTAREIKRFAGKNFTDFGYLKVQLKRQ